MSAIAVQKVKEGDGIPSCWLGDLLQFTEQVRRKAFKLFEESGRPHGHEVNHWLEAERQLLSVPRYELFETAEAIDVCIAVPGFDADEISVAALSDAVLIRAESGPMHEKHEGAVRYSEFDDRALFRRIPLPAQIDVNRVTARLDKGILTIAAPKTKVACECIGCRCETAKGAA